MSRLEPPQDKMRYFDGSVWHPHFAWKPVWIVDHYEWLRWVWKRHINIEHQHRLTTDFLSQKGADE